MLKKPSEQTVKTTKLTYISDILHRPILVKKELYGTAVLLSSAGNIWDLLC
jgi:hypothetical protein